MVTTGYPILQQLREIEGEGRDKTEVNNSSITTLRQATSELWKLQVTGEESHSH